MQMTFNRLLHRAGCRRACSDFPFHRQNFLHHYHHHHHLQTRACSRLCLQRMCRQAGHPLPRRARLRSARPAARAPFTSRRGAIRARPLDGTVAFSTSAAALRSQTAGGMPTSNCAMLRWSWCRQDFVEAARLEALMLAAQRGLPVTRA